MSPLSDDKHPSIPASVLRDVQFSLKSHQYQISTSSPYQIKCGWCFFSQHNLGLALKGMSHRVTAALHLLPWLTSNPSQYSVVSVGLVTAPTKLCVWLETLFASCHVSYKTWYKNEINQKQIQTFYKVNWLCLNWSFLIIHLFVSNVIVSGKKIIIIIRTLTSDQNWELVLTLSLETLMCSRMSPHSKRVASSMLRPGAILLHVVLVSPGHPTSCHSETIPNSGWMKVIILQ